MHCCAVQITLIGLFAVMFSHCLTWYYIPNLTEEEVDAAPLWLWALCGACLAFYSNMDNMDGKQARKIGASSALGLLFDHGCDAINGGMVRRIAWLNYAEADVDLSSCCSWLHCLCAV